MNAAKHAILLFCSIMGIAVLGWYFARAKTDYILDEKALAKTPDAIVSGLNVRQFNEKGELIHHLKTSLLTHIPENDKHYLLKPLILAAEEKQPVWKIESEQAVAVNGGDQIHFTKKVVIHQKADNKTPARTIRTEAITYYPQTKKAVTPLLVTMEQPGISIQSIGMNAWLDEKKVQLLHQARGRYVPAKG